MPDLAPSSLVDLVTAHRILVREDVLDAFGHVSVRDPDNSDRFWLSVALPPSAVQVSDFAPFGMDGEPSQSEQRPLFIERYIHSEIFKARPDVQAICHHHAPAILPFCVGFGPLYPLTQTGAFIGGPAPTWDSADEFGDTPMLVANAEQAASLARTLGGAALVLMRGHGATVVGSSIADVVYKSVYSCREASLLQAIPSANVKPLSTGEIKAVGHPRPQALARCWHHWTDSHATASAL
jgi:HCOMODA/2-hydroxy-3-carboxy-muconic semialdehyde decarboxylase